MQNGRNGEADRLKLKPRVVSSVLIMGCHAEEAQRRGRWRGKQAGQRVLEKLLLLLRERRGGTYATSLGQMSRDGEWITDANRKEPIKRLEKESCQGEE